MKAVNLDVRHMEATGRALRELREAGDDGSNMQLSAALLLMCIAERYRIDVETMMQHIVANAGAVARNPSLFSHIYNRVDDLSQRGRIYVPTGDVARH